MKEKHNKFAKPTIENVSFVCIYSWVGKYNATSGVPIQWTQERSPSLQADRENTIEPCGTFCEPPVYIYTLCNHLCTMYFVYIVLFQRSFEAW